MKQQEHTTRKPTAYLGLLVIPLELILGTMITKIPFIQNNELLSTCTSTLVFIIGFLFVIFLFKDFLKEQWQQYKADKFGRKILVSILLVIGAHLLLALSRFFLGNDISGNLSMNDQDTSGMTSIFLLIIATIPPVIAPFAEELTFRYLLFGRFQKKTVKILMFFVSAILFGLIHLNNFNGNWVQTIPYMIMGAYFSLIYYFSKNIWGSIFVHWIFNTVNSVGSLLLLGILQLLGA